MFIKPKKINPINLVFLIIYLSAGFVFPSTGWAQEETLNFHVQPEFPNSQLKDSTNYFDLNLNPGQTEKLKLVLTNDKEEAIQVKITPHTAYTNVNGVVEYGKDPEKPDPTLPYSLNSMIEVPEIVDLDGKESKIVELLLTMPKDSYEGILAGGLRIEENLKEEKQSDEGEGLAIKNEFSYVIGVIVSNNRSVVEPELDLLEVFADQLNYRNVFSATIQNFTPSFVNQLLVEAEIRAKGKDEVLYSTSQEQLQMAPNSNFNFPIPLNGDRFVSGDYVLTMKARSGEKEWSWTEAFTIKAEAARRLNREDVTIDSSINMWIISSCILFVLFIVLIAYIFFKKKREEKKRKNMLKKKIIKSRKNQNRKKQKKLVRKKNPQEGNDLNE